MLCFSFSLRGTLSFAYHGGESLENAARAWRLRQTEAVETEPRWFGGSELHRRHRSSGGVYHQRPASKRQKTG